MKLFTAFLLSLCISMSAFAQGPGNRRAIEERYRSQKVAFITDQMQLTPVEAEAFWPIYKQYETEKDNLTLKMRKIRSTFPEDEAELTEEQSFELLNIHNAHLEAMFKLENVYQKKYLEVISAKKLLLLINSENDFRKHLLKEFRGRGMGMNRNNN